MSKKLLIITYHYPPDLAVGAIRASKFAEYLPEFDIEPIVLTVKEKYYEHLDSKAPKDSNQYRDVFRTLRIPNFRDIFLSLKSIFIRHGVKGLSQKKKENDNQSNPQKKSETFIERFKRYFNSLVVWLPDDKTGWIIPAFLKGLFLVYYYRIDAIYTTGPPHSVHLVGLLLKLLTGKKWVSDFRDPWLFEDKPDFIRSKVSDRIDRWLSDHVVVNSDVVISVTPEMTVAFQNSFPKLNKNKFVTIYNGYDPKDLFQYLVLEKHKKITFTYAGSFYLGRDPELFFKGLRKLIDEEVIQEDKVAVKLIGSCRYLYETSIEEMADRIGLSKIVRFIDYIPRHQALIEMAKSHVLILLAQNQPLQIPGKLYEYIGLNSNILAVCEPGATANLISMYSKAVLVSEKNIDTMKEALRKVIELVNSTEIYDPDTGLNMPDTLQLERKKQAGELAKYLEQ